MIYFLQSVDGGPVKIGHSVDVEARRVQLERHYGTSLAILATIDGDREEEQAIHARFSHLRLGKTEQFEPDVELLEFINRPLFANATPVKPMSVVPNGRPGDRKIVLRCTSTYRKRVEQAARLEFRDASSLIALALQEYFKDREYEPLPNRLGEER